MGLVPRICYYTYVIQTRQTSCLLVGILKRITTRFYFGELGQASESDYETVTGKMKLRWCEKKKWAATLWRWQESEQNQAGNSLTFKRAASMYTIQGTAWKTYKQIITVCIMEEGREGHILHTHDFFNCLNHIVQNLSKIWSNVKDNVPNRTSKSTKKRLEEKISMDTQNASYSNLFFLFLWNL